MIGVACWPKNWDWKPSSSSKPTDSSFYYLEVFGETTPSVDTDYARLLSPPSGDGTTESGSIYQYWWTLGHDGVEKQSLGHRGLSLKFPLAKKLKVRKEIAAQVFLYFPLSHGWRIKELAATVVYLSPVRASKSLMTAVAQDWKTISPLLEDAGTIAGLAGGAPAAAGAAKAASGILNALANLQINSVPPTGDSEWSVAKVALGKDAGGDVNGLMQGVRWDLPREVFDRLGCRLTGCLAVKFIPTGALGQTDPQLSPGDLCAKAIIYAKATKDGVRVPGEDEFLRLTLSPLG